MLKVLQRAKKEVPLDIVMNLLAAHSVPQGYTAEEATEMIIKEMIPAVIALKEKGELDVELIDISLFSTRVFLCLNPTLSVRRTSTMWLRLSAL